MNVKIHCLRQQVISHIIAVETKKKEAVPNAE